MPVSLKLFGFVFIAFFCLSVLRVAYWGRRSRNRRPLTIQAHKRAVNFLFVLIAAIAVMVLLIELFARANGNAEYGALFWYLHLPSAILCVLFFGAMRIHFTGERYYNLHRYLAYPAVVSSLVMALSGSVLLYNV